VSVNPFEMRWVENYRTKLHAHRASVDSYYKGEEIALKHRYAAEIEQYRASTAMDIEQYRASTGRDLENIRHGNHLEVEEKRSTLSRWVAEFNGQNAKELEDKRHTGSLTLQEREHVHRRALLELDIAEDRLKADNEHAKSLELAKKTHELTQFRVDREAIYALELRRFDGIVSERQASHVQLLQEYGTRSRTGESVVSSTASMVTTSIQGNQKLNEKLFDAIAGALAQKATHRNKMEELEKRGELGLSSEIDRFKKENGL
jgi:hypothetical protein